MLSVVNYAGQKANKISLPVMSVFCKIMLWLILYFLMG